MGLLEFVDRRRNIHCHYNSGLRKKLFWGWENVALFLRFKLFITWKLLLTLKRRLMWRYYVVVGYSWSQPTVMEERYDRGVIALLEGARIHGVWIFWNFQKMLTRSAAKEECRRAHGIVMLTRILNLSWTADVITAI